MHGQCEDWCLWRVLDLKNISQEEHEHSYMIGMKMLVISFTPRRKLLCRCIEFHDKVSRGCSKLCTGEGFSIEGDEIRCEGEFEWRTLDGVLGSANQTILFLWFEFQYSNYGLLVSRLSCWRQDFSIAYMWVGVGFCIIWAFTWKKSGFRLFSIRVHLILVVL